MLPVPNVIGGGHVPYPWGGEGREGREGGELNAEGVGRGGGGNCWSKTRRIVESPRLKKIVEP